MKTLPLLKCILFIAITFSLTSCVSKGKYLTEQERAERLQNDSITAQNNLATCNQKLRTLEQERESLQNSLTDLSTSTEMTIAEQAKRLQNLQNLLNTQRESVDQLRKRIADALVNFGSDELTISVRDGKVYVSLEEKLLFKSGSAQVDPKGKQALASLSEVLKNTPNIDVLIEGHTDTVPLRGGRFEDNWGLSVARATSIVRILTKENGVNPERVVAAGRSEYVPVQTNRTAEGRSANRRTEIILSPNLEELFKILEG